MARPLDKNILGTQITDEFHNSVGAGFCALGHDTFFGALDMQIATLAAGGGVVLIENIDYTLHDTDSVLTAECGKNVYTTYKIINPVYQACDLFFTYKTVGDYREAADVTPTGVISAFGGTVAPAGYLMCDGASYVRTEHEDLFDVIGTAYGTADADHFNVPKLQGQFLRGRDNGEAVDPDAATRVALQAGGNVGDLVGSQQADAMQGHWHAKYYESADATTTGGAPRESTAGNNNSGPLAHTSVKAAITDGVNGVPRTAAETRAQNVYVNFIIKT